jgi:hypothetical protein
MDRELLVSVTLPSLTMPSRALYPVVLGPTGRAFAGAAPWGEVSAAGRRDLAADTSTGQRVGRLAEQRKRPAGPAPFPAPKSWRLLRELRWSNARVTGLVKASLKVSEY